MGDTKDYQGGGELGEGLALGGVWQAKMAEGNGAPQEPL